MECFPQYLIIDVNCSSSWTFFAYLLRSRFVAHIYGLPLIQKFQPENMHILHVSVTYHMCEELSQNRMQNAVDLGCIFIHVKLEYV